jgi:SAM-dependent methyltransferase
MRLNLGCGNNKLDGFVNVDKEAACAPDQVVDLESFPWPFDDNAADEIVLSHTLEHLGQATDVYLAIIKELYRICRPGAIVRITVPHPRHDEFLIDPTHVRAILPEQFQMFSKAKNREWQDHGFANTPLALYLDVDFELDSVEVIPAEPWLSRLRAGDITSEELAHKGMHEFNILKEIRMVVRAVKD